jgi:hypothetical protein
MVDRKASAGATAKAKAIGQSLRATRFTTAFGRAVFGMWRGMRPETEASGYREVAAVAGAKAETTWFLWWKRSDRYGTVETLGVLRLRLRMTPF